MVCHQQQTILVNFVFRFQSRNAIGLVIVRIFHEGNGYSEGAAIKPAADQVGAISRWKNSVIVLFLESGSALSLHDVSKKDLNLGLSENLFGSIIWIQQRSW